MSGHDIAVILNVAYCCWQSWCSQGVVGVSAVPLEQAVAGGPAVTGFPAVEGVLVVASVPVDPGVNILAGGFTYLIVEWDVGIILSDNRIVAIGLSFFSAIEL